MKIHANPAVTSILIGVHAALALAAGLFPVFVSASDSVDDMAAILALSQMSLLSLWIGFGNAHLLLRLGAIAGAGICLATLILSAEAGGWPMFSGFGWFVLGVVFAPVPCVAIPSVIVRRRWAQVIRVIEPASCVGSNSFQFSLAHALQWTAILSVLLAFSRLLAGFSGVFGQLATMTVLVALLGFICGSVSLASLWASLSEVQPTFRVVAVTILAASLGLIAGYALTGKKSTIDWFVFSGISTVIALVVLVSLLFLRVAGYRLRTLQEASEA